MRLFWPTAALNLRAVLGNCFFYDSTMLLRHSKLTAIQTAPPRSRTNLQSERSWITPHQEQARDVDRRRPGPNTALSFGVFHVGLARRWETESRYSADSTDFFKCIGQEQRPVNGKFRAIAVVAGAVEPDIHAKRIDSNGRLPGFTPSGAA
jgi:hypothetical protein